MIATVAEVAVGVGTVFTVASNVEAQRLTNSSQVLDDLSRSVIYSSLYEQVTELGTCLDKTLRSIANADIFV